MGNRVEFRLLGPVQVRVGGHAVPLGDRKQRLLLAMLLLDANKVVPMARMVRCAWQEAPPPTAHRVVQAHMSRLRTVLALAGAGESGLSLTRHGNGYQLRCDLSLIDVHTFRMLHEKARITRDDTDKAGLLRQALAIWRGPALADVTNDELRVQLCQGLEEAQLTATEEWADAELRLGHHALLIEQLTDLVARYPDRQRIVGQLMLALHRGLRTGDALRVYEHTKRRMREELGLDLAAPLERLHTAILRADPALDCVAPELADWSSTQFPADVRNFTGREACLNQIWRLRPGRVPVPAAPACVIITGRSGVGKTALAIHAAYQMAGDFPHGRLYLNLQGHSAAPMTTREALTAIFRLLNVPASQVPADLDQAAALYRSVMAGKSIVVVLDDVHSTEQVCPLLPRCPTCMVLITSRTNLPSLTARERAHQMELGPLGARDATGSVVATAALPRPSRSELTRLIATGLEAIQRSNVPETVKGELVRTFEENLTYDARRRYSELLLALRLAELTGSH